MTDEQIAELRFNANHVLKWPIAERLIDERKSLLAALKAVEWAGIPADVGPACPACAMEQDEGHEQDCRLAAAIAKAESP